MAGGAARGRGDERPPGEDQLRVRRPCAENRQLGEPFESAELRRLIARMVEQRRPQEFGRARVASLPYAPRVGRGSSSLATVPSTAPGMS